MNSDFPGNYPTGNFLQQSGDGSYPNHVGHQWHHPSGSQDPNQYSAPPPNFYNPCANEIPYQQQQVANDWTNWPEQNNNAPDAFAAIPTSLNPQTEPSQWKSSNSSQYNSYLDSNTTQHPNLEWQGVTGYPNAQSQDYTSPELHDYSSTQSHNYNNWQQPVQMTQAPHWDPQSQLAVTSADAGIDLNYTYDFNQPPVTDNKMEILTGQLQDCSLNEPAQTETDFSSHPKNSIEEPNEEVPPSFQQIESLPEVAVPAPELEAAEGQFLSKASVISPRKGSLFQPPVPSSVSLTPSPTVKQDLLFPGELVVQQDQSLERISPTWTKPATPEVKEENLCDKTAPLPVEESVQSHSEEQATENSDETANTSGSRPHPLHLVLHRQHFSNDVDGTCRTTLWENPVNINPSVTLMPWAKQSPTDPKESEVESKNKPSTQELRLEEPSKVIPASEPRASSARSVHEETSLLKEAPTNPPNQCSLQNAQPNIERNPEQDVGSETQRQNSSQHRVSPTVDNRWTEDKAYDRSRQEHRREDRNYDNMSPQRKHSYTDHPGDPRYFRPGYYPQPTGNYSSRPSSRASEPAAENYYSYDRERTPSRLSEVNDDRRNRDMDKSRGGSYRSSDQIRRPYDDPRDFDRRSWNYDPRDNYDYRRSGHEQDRNNRTDYVEGEADYDHQRHSYSDRQYSRGRHDDGYNFRPPSKGYDYYPSWPDPYAMYYAQYYRNYQAAAYGSRNNYGYHKELYETDPKYKQRVDDNYQAYLNSQQRQADYDSDHPSIHSGRSSVNDELRRDRVDHSQDFSDSSLGDSITQPTPPPRMTPAKFPTPHPVAQLSQGHVVTVLPSCSTFSCNVNIYDLQNKLCYDPCLKVLKDFPGPLISGQTHKKDVMSFCQTKVQELQATREPVLDRSSQILLWELLILLVRQNGNVIGSDIAELLLKDVQSTPAAQTPTSSHLSGTSPSVLLSDDLQEGRPSSQGNPVDNSPSSTPSPDEGIVVSQDRALLNNELPLHQVTHKFTEYLLYGNKKDALEWAVRHNLWGHALFLAYRMGSHNHANLMTRFANSLPLNDPLQTLYQLMSGRQPISVTSVADEKWGDWRPHLAMILSNPTHNHEVDLRSIITLGDTLAQKGCLYAAHFCYLMAQAEFGTFDNKACKYVLLGANHRLPFEKFATSEAIQLTEIYEYAMSLARPNYMQTNFQPYKFLYATRLADYGMLKEALQYCEVMSSAYQQFPHYVSLSLFKQLHQLSDRLKYQDSHYTNGAGELEELGDPPWLTQLKETVTRLKEGQIGASTNYPSENNQLQANYSQEARQEDYGSSYVYQQEVQQQSASQEQTAMMSSSADQVSLMNMGNEMMSNYYPASFSYNQGSAVHESDQISQLPSFTSQSQPAAQEQTSNRLSTSYYDQIPTAAPVFPTQGSQSLSRSVSSRERQDSVSSTTSRKGSIPAQPPNSFSSALSQEEGGGSGSFQDASPTKSSQKGKQDASKKLDPAKTQASRSWFGSIVNKLLPKGPNQMILPDDKSPKIVWDAKTNMWVDLDGNSDDVANANIPPPKDSELAPLPGVQGQMNAVSSAPPTEQNRFQRPKHRGMRQNYVDILNSNTASGGKQSTTSSAAPDSLFPRMDTSSDIPSSFFIPSPVSFSENNNSDLGNPDASAYMPSDINPVAQEPETSQTPLLNPADFNMNARQDFRETRKPSGSRLIGRRTYPS